MHIREYQAWLQAWDEERGWEQVLLSHTLLHAMEELGEVSKLAQAMEGYRSLPPGGLDALRDRLAEELSDLQVMLFKVAYLCEIDMESALQRGMAKADQRYPDPATGPADVAASWERFSAFLERQGLTSLLQERLADSHRPSPAPSHPDPGYDPAIESAPPQAPEASTPVD
jgi:NTP pyrophosphatase (non-canonical NTP hydrolase)